MRPPNGIPAKALDLLVELGIITGDPYTLNTGARGITTWHPNLPDYVCPDLPGADVTTKSADEFRTIPDHTIAPCPCAHQLGQSKIGDLAQDVAQIRDATQLAHETLNDPPIADHTTKARLHQLRLALHASQPASRHQYPTLGAALDRAVEAAQAADTLLEEIPARQLDMARKVHNGVAKFSKVRALAKKSADPSRIYTRAIPHAFDTDRQTVLGWPLADLHALDWPDQHRAVRGELTQEQTDLAHQWATATTWVNLTTEDEDLLTLTRSYDPSGRYDTRAAVVQVPLAVLIHDAIDNTATLAPNRGERPEEVARAVRLTPDNMAPTVADLLLALEATDA